MPEEFPENAYCPECGEVDFLGWLVGGKCTDCIKKEK